MDLYAVFINLIKAFDTVNREALQFILTKPGCPQKFIHIIQLFHGGMTGLILSRGDTSTPFIVYNGGKQAVFWLLPFSTCFSHVY